MQLARDMKRKVGNMQNSESPADHRSEAEKWDADDLGEQSSYEGTTEIDRRLRRENEAQGDPDARDVAGSVPESDLPHKRESS